MAEERLRGERLQIMLAVDELRLVDDFRFECSQNLLHVSNVPSPAATASLVISRAIVDMAGERFALSA